MLAAIHSGCDWADASADYLIIPDGVSVQAERYRWKAWYTNEYCGKNNVPYISFVEWLEKAGARKATPEDIKVFDYT